MDNPCDAFVDWPYVCRVRRRGLGLPLWSSEWPSSPPPPPLESSPSGPAAGCCASTRAEESQRAAAAMNEWMDECNASWFWICSTCVLHPGLVAKLLVLLCQLLVAVLHSLHHLLQLLHLLLQLLVAHLKVGDAIHQLWRLTEGENTLYPGRKPLYPVDGIQFYIIFIF